MEIRTDILDKKISKLEHFFKTNQNYHQKEIITFYENKTLEKRVAELEKRIYGKEKTICNLEKRIVDLEEEVVNLEKRVNNVENSLRENPNYQEELEEIQSQPQPKLQQPCTIPEISFGFQ